MQKKYALQSQFIIILVCIFYIKFLLYSVTGLKSGREFAVVIRASNTEGMSPPSVLSAYTLRDTAQTLKGVVFIYVFYIDLDKFAALL